MELIWEGIFFRATGYADATRNYVRALHEAGVPVRIEAKDLADCGGHVPEPYRSLLGTPVSPFAPYVQHIQPHDFKYTEFPRSVLRIGYTVFETDRIPGYWVDLCNRMDEIWVPCTFNRETFTRSGVQPGKVHVVPHAIDTCRFHADVPPRHIVNRRGFHFLSVFHWQKRKGWDLLLRAYLQAFNAADDVALFLKVSGENVEDDIRSLIRDVCGHRSPPDIRLNTSYMPPDQLPGLYTSADCLVLPFRGEGFGLPLAEAMACGLPAIATDWGGPRDFLTKENGYPIPVAGMSQPDRWFLELTRAEDTHRWAEPDLDTLTEILRHVYRNRDEVRDKGRRAAADIVSAFRYPVIANVIRERLSGVFQDSWLPPARPLQPSPANK